MSEGDAYSLSLPNLRAHFLPDPGYALVEADLARADAQVIAWEAGAVELKRALSADEDIHADNSDVLFCHKWVGPKLIRTADPAPRHMHSNGMTYRDGAKRWVHLTNFAGGFRTAASVLVLNEDHVKRCQHWWCHERHPEIGRLHRRVDTDLKTRKNPVMHNAFGFRRLYVGGDRTHNLLGQALAWIAQSTVAGVINNALLQVDCARDLFGQRRCGECLVCDYPEAQLLLQIHDSLLLQLPATNLDQAFIDRLKRAMRVVVPYDDPLVIGSDIKYSTTHWGAMQKWQG